MFKSVIVVVNIIIIAKIILFDTWQKRFIPKYLALGHGSYKTSLLHKISHILTMRI